MLERVEAMAAIEGAPHVDAEALLAALPVAVYTTDADGYITAYNAAAARLWGRKPALGQARWCGSLLLFRPDGTAMALDECPLATALRSGDAPSSAEALLERPDGGRVPFLAYPTLLRDADGKVTGAVNTLVDISDRKRQEDLQPRLSAIVASSHDAIISKDLNGIITSWNESAERVFGYAADEIVGQSVMTLIPPDRAEEEPRIIERIRRGEVVDHFETIRRRKDGTLIPISLTISPIRAADGRITGVSKIARDISDRRESEQRIRALLREVNHRVKNQFAVILSMIRETNSRTADPVQFERLVRERIMALSRSHDLMVQSDWRGAQMADLVLAHLRPTGDEDLLALAGPPVMLNAMAVQYIGMAVLELVMNSAREGTLARGTGRIVVEWAVEADASGVERLAVRWSEPYDRPALYAEQGGFAALVLAKVTPAAVSGTAALSMDGEMLTWTLSAPLSAVLSHGVEPVIRSF